MPRALNLDKIIVFPCKSTEPKKLEDQLKIAEFQANQSKIFVDYVPRERLDALRAAAGCEKGLFLAELGARSFLAQASPPVARAALASLAANAWGAALRGIRRGDGASSGGAATSAARPSMTSSSRTAISFRSARRIDTRCLWCAA